MIAAAGVWSQVKKLVAIALLLSTPGYCATCTINGVYLAWALSAGHWTGTGCTGPTFVPGNGDRALLGNSADITIAVGESVTLGTSPTSTGVAAIANTTDTGTGIFRVAGEFIYRGPVLEGAGWHINNGARLRHDSSVSASPSTTHYPWRLNGYNIASVLTATGTSVSPIIWDTAPGSGTAGTVGSQYGIVDGGGIDANWVQWSNIGNASTNSFVMALVSPGAIGSIQNSTCTNCGGVSYPTIGDGVTLRFNGNSFSTIPGSGMAYRTLALGGGGGADIVTMTSGLREIKGNYLANGNVFCYSAAGVVPHIAFQDNVLYASGAAQNSSGLFNAVGGGDCHMSAGEWRNNLTSAYDNSASGTASGLPGGEIGPMYSLLGSSAPCNSGVNYHGWNVFVGVNSHITQAIGESDCAQAGGKFILTQGGVGPGPWTLKIDRSILVPTGGTGETMQFYDNAVSCAQGGSSYCAVVELSRNTVYASPVTDVCGLYGQESLNAAGMTSAVEDNIGWKTTPSAGCKMGSNAYIADGAIVGADHNWWWNLSSGGYNTNFYGDPSDFASPAPPGQNDVSNSDPQFRGCGGSTANCNFLGFCKSLNPADTSWADCLAHFRAKEPGYTPAALIAFVQNGFIPGNPATATAGHAGGQVGAMDYEAPSGSGRKRVVVTVK